MARVIHAMAVVFSVVTSSASAASITLQSYKADDGSVQPVLFLSGEMVSSDALTFERLARQIDGQATVLLNSPGGDLEAGIAIGRVIRAKEFSTAVFDMCASACALSWLAGHPRYTSAQAQVGFHVAFTGGEIRHESGMGNALVGLYVGELGMGENVVRYVTSAAPEDMQWLSARDASLLGINVQTLDGQTQLASIRTPGTPQEQSDVPPAPPAVPLSDEEAAKAFVRRYNTAWSLPNASAMAFMRGVYVGSVNFYGEFVDAETVLHDKQTFAERWPLRFYHVEENSLSASCNASLCTVTGLVDWFAKSTVRRKSASGIANFAVVVDVSRGRVTSEESKVIKGHKPGVEPLLAAWNEFNGRCRGGGGDDQSTMNACAARDFADAALAAADWCYGHGDEAEYLKSWHQCDRASAR